ncbi:MAG: hypothetical protein Q4E39_05425 [bacterium]|nr:hypothetical protein [bacterium]
MLKNIQSISQRKNIRLTNTTRRKINESEETTTDAGNLPIGIDC